MKTGILFDLDGTLLDTLQDLTDAVNHTMERYGCPKRSVEDVRRFIGNGARQLIALSAGEKAEFLDVDRMLSDYKRYYDAHCQVKTAPYPGIPEALEQISQRYPVAIVSNKPDPAVKILCRHYFGDTYALGETTDCPRKPAPDMLYKAMAAMDVEACIYVGDTEVDLETAQNAAMPCISVLWGFRDRKILENAGGKYFCAGAEQLLPTIEKIITEEVTNGQ